MPSRAWSALLVALLTWPLIAIPLRFVWLAQTHTGQQIAQDWLQRLGPALMVSIQQGLICSALATVLAIGVLPFLLAPPQSAKWLARLLVLGPSLAPPFVLVLGWFRLFPDWTGTLAVSLVLAVSIAGFQAVQLAEVANERLRAQAEIAHVMGMSRWHFLTRVAGPTLWSDLAHGAALSFAIAVSSLTIPLLLGSSRQANLEVLALQSFAREGKWLESMAYAQVQVLLVFLVSALLLRRSPDLPQADERLSGEQTQSVLHFLRWRWLAALLFVPWSVLCAGLWFRPEAAMNQLAGWSNFTGDIVGAFLSSLVVAVLFAAFTTALGALAVFSGLRGISHSWLNWTVSPSAVLVGLACLSIGPRHGPGTLLTMAIGLAICLFPFAYRWGLATWMIEIKAWRDLGQVLGLTPWRLFTRVLWPEFWRNWAPVLGLMLIWAWSDYSVTAIIADRDRTLALLAQSQLQSYRLDLASALVGLCLACGAVSYVLFHRSRHVFGS